MRRINTIIPIFIFGILILNSCRQPYQIILGKTFFSTHVSSGNRQHSLIEGSSERLKFSVNGVYGHKSISKYNLPTIYAFNRAAGIKYTILADSLSYEYGAWVRVEGTLSEKSLTFSVAGAEMMLSVLHVERADKLGDTKPFVVMAQHEYEKIRDRIQESITSKGSKLRLPQNPDWFSLIDEKLRQVIVSMHVNDLMYAAEVDFVFDMNQSKLLFVYANEWFKGE